MKNLSLLVLTELKNDRVQPITHPANCPMLFRDIGSLVEPVRLREQLLRFFESNATEASL